MRRRVPDWLLERYALGELDPAQEAEIRAHLDSEPEDRARLRALREADRDFLERHPPRAIAALIHVRMGSRRPRWGGLAVPALASAALASLALLVVAVVDGEGGEIRMKGLAPSILLHRSQDGVVERLRDGASAREGDLVQLSYLAAGKRFGVVLSIDGKGVVSLHHPLDSAWAAPLSSEGTVSLPYAYELDDAPDFERFFFLAADEPFSVHEALDAAGRMEPGASRLPLREEIVQASFLLRKP